MEDIFLVSREIKPYRVPVYDFISESFVKKDYKFNVFTNSISEYAPESQGVNIIKGSLSFFKVRQAINELEPEVVILFLHLKDFVIWPLIHWLKIKGIPVVYWNHGVNLQDPDNKFKYIFFNYIHSLSDAILLYDDAQEKYIRSANQDKVFVANNTLNFYSFPEISNSKQELKSKWNLKRDNYILFVGRIQPRKRLPDLIEAYSKLDSNDCGLVVVGPGINKEVEKRIDNLKGAHYLGSIYGDEIHELYKLADIFCLPGAVGLPINQAFYWETPLITEDTLDGPEIAYLKTEKNGFVVPEGQIDVLAKRLEELINDDELRQKFARHARKTILEEASPENMFNGFKHAVEYCESLSR